MKKIILLLIAVFTFQLGQSQYRTDLAEASPRMEARADQQAKKLTKKLALNGEQPLLVKNKLTEFYVKRQEVIDADLSKEEKKKQMKALEINKLKEMRDILTQPQYDQLLKVEKEMRQKRLEKRKSKMKAKKH